MTDRQYPIHVAISLPAGDTVKSGFAFDLANMVGATTAARTDIAMRIHMVRTSVLPRSRESLVLQALQHDCDWTLWLDSDMRFPRNTLLQLLARDEYIVGANYPTRANPPKPVTFANDDDASVRVFTEEGATECESVASIGFGCVLVHTDVFRAMSRPWFSVEWDPATREFIGEDVFFSRKAREELGAKILIDHKLSHEIRHCGEFEFSLAHARAFRDSQAEQKGGLIIAE